MKSLFGKFALGVVASLIVVTPLILRGEDGKPPEKRPLSLASSAEERARALKQERAERALAIREERERLEHARKQIEKDIAEKSRAYQSMRRRPEESRKARELIAARDKISLRNIEIQSQLEVLKAAVDKPENRETIVLVIKRFSPGADRSWTLSAYLASLRMEQEKNTLQDDLLSRAYKLTVATENDVGLQVDLLRIEIDAKKKLYEKVLMRIGEAELKLLGLE